MSETSVVADPGVGLYLDLLKKILTNVIYEDASFAKFTNLRREADPGEGVPDGGLGEQVWNYDPAARAVGMDWPTVAHTMIGQKRLDNLHACLDQVLADDIPGDLIETGVWRGGACIFMRGFLKAHGRTDRVVWVADSFEGLPEPTENDLTPEVADSAVDLAQVNERVLGVPLATVRDNFTRYGLLDEQVRFLPGWFKDTLPTAPIERLAILRLDGDFYESTRDALENLYPKLSPGGFVIIDDYLVPGCRTAVTEFRARHGIDDAVHTIDDTGVFWRRTA